MRRLLIACLGALGVCAGIGCHTAGYNDCDPTTRGCGKGWIGNQGGSQCAGCGGSRHGEVVYQGPVNQGYQGYQGYQTEPREYVTVAPGKQVRPSEPVMKMPWAKHPQPEMDYGSSPSQPRIQPEPLFKSSLVKNIKSGSLFSK